MDASTVSRPSSGRPWWQAPARAWGIAVDGAAGTLGPLLDLYVRIWLAQSFFISGLLKVANWDNALALARYEYPVAWMDPVTAAYTGASIELIAPVFLALGLATRAAALPMMVLALVIQFNYQALDTHLLWAALLGGYVVRGAGALSLDRLLGSGLADSALPLAAPLANAAAWVTRHLEPAYRLLLCLWLAAALAIAGGVALDALPARLLVTDAIAAVPAALALTAALLLAAGLALRATVVALVLVVLGMAMMQPARIDSIHLLVLLLAGLALAGAGRYSLDAVLAQALRRRWPALTGGLAFDLARAPRVVIVGAGFGGLACARSL